MFLCCFNHARTGNAFAARQRVAELLTCAPECVCDATKSGCMHTHCRAFTERHPAPRCKSSVREALAHLKKALMFSAHAASAFCSAAASAA